MTTYQFILGIALSCIVSTAAGATNDLSALNDVELVRELQTSQTLNYRATYVADFQYLLDAFCTGDPPTLQLSCYGTEMTILNTSDPTILCSQLTIAAVPNGTTYQCQNTCVGSYCENVYGIGNLGSIEFMCEGNDHTQIESEYIYLSGADGRCEVSTSTRSLNFHAGRLGVLCPVGTTRNYVYDDTFFDCRNYGQDGGILDYAEGNEDDILGCYTGNDCEGDACDIVFEDLSFISESASFLDTCVESNVELTNAPTDSPVPSNPTLTFSSRFEASWAQLYGTTNTQTACTSENPSVTVTCGDFATITYVNATDTSVNCTNTNESEMICMSDGTNVLLDTFTSVFFDCTGSVIPTAQVYYPESDVSCTNSVLPATVQNAVTLGISCTIAGEQFYYYRDLAFECRAQGHNFDIVYDMYGFDRSRYICSESAMFAPGTTSTQTISNVSIYTDWQLNPEGCYLLNGQPTGGDAPGPTPIPISVPTSPPVVVSPPTSPPILTNAPVTTTTIAPVTSSTTLPTNAPILAPTMLPIVTTVATTRPTIKLGTTTDNTSSNSSSSNNSNNNTLIGIVIGCVGGGFGLAALIGLLIMGRNKKQRNGDDNNNYHSKSINHSVSYDTGHRSNPNNQYQYHHQQQQQYRNHQYHQQQQRGDGTESYADNDFMPYAVGEEEHDIRVPPSSPSPTAYTTGSSNRSSPGAASAFGSPNRNNSYNHSNNNYNSSSNRNNAVMAYDDTNHLDAEGRYKRDFSVYMVHPDAFENATPATAARLKSPPY